MTNPVLIDTHVLLWYAKGDSRLDPVVRTLIRDPQNIPYISKASLWEITIKSSLGKLDLEVSFDAFLDELPKQGFQFLDIEPADLRILYTLPMHHGDPFDRLIIAQAIAHSWPVISDDSKFKLYPVKIITG
ncbi:type II toxin-antitoxin system VapC family toxin [Nibrella viscosa]|uniref:Type II toxin-antitoxin system VapC family toxin n=1 Tax=Nibrella viscosa TaxID=1084524 RepID=A0ABP8K6H1_9BACT